MSEITREKIISILQSEDKFQNQTIILKKSIEQNQEGQRIICLTLYEILKLNQFQLRTKLLALKLSIYIMNLKYESFVTLYENLVLNALEELIEISSNNYPLSIVESSSDEVNQLKRSILNISLECIYDWAKFYHSNQDGKPSKYMQLYLKLLKQGVQFQSHQQNFQDNTKFQENTCIEDQIKQVQKNFPLQNHLKRINNSTCFKNLTQSDVIRLTQNYIQQSNNFIIYLNENWDLSIQLTEIEKLNYDIESLVVSLTDLEQEDLAAIVSNYKDIFDEAKKYIRALISQPQYSQLEQWIQIRKKYMTLGQDDQYQQDRIKQKLEQKQKEGYQMKGQNFYQKQINDQSNISLSDSLSSSILDIRKKSNNLELECEQQLQQIEKECKLLFCQIQQEKIYSQNLQQQNNIVNEELQQLKKEIFELNNINKDLTQQIKLYQAKKKITIEEYSQEKNQDNQIVQNPCPLKNFKQFPTSLNLITIKAQPIEVNSQIFEILYPYQNSEQYYNNKRKKQRVGSLIEDLIFEENSISQMTQHNQSYFKIMCLGKTNMLFENQDFKIYLAHRLQIESQTHFNTFGLYIFCKNQKIQWCFTEFRETERFSTFWAQPLKKEILLNNNTPVLIEVVVKSTQLEIGPLKLNISYQDMNQEILIPIHICQQIQYYNIDSKNGFKQNWMKIKKNIQKTPIFNMNKSVFNNLDQFRHYFPQLIIMNEHKQKDYHNSIDELKIGGFGNYNNQEFYIKFELIPQNRMAIYISYSQNQDKKQRNILQDILRGYAFIFGEK